MTYIIIDPEGESHAELMNSLDCLKELVFKGSFSSFKSAEEAIHSEPPDIAFIRIGDAKFNAFPLVSEINAIAPLSKVILMSNYVEDAVQAFEYKADGFILKPFDEEKIRYLLMRFIEKRQA